MAEYSIDQFLKSAEEQVGTVLDNINTASSDVDKIFKGVDGIVEHSSKMFEGDFSNFAESLPGLIDQVDSLRGSIESNNPLFQGFVSILGDVSKGLNTMNTVINLTKQSIEIMNKVLKGNPGLLVISILAALAAMFIHLWQNSETFREAVTGLFERFSPLVEGAKAVFEMFADTVGNLAGMLGEFFGGLVEDVVDFFTSLYDIVINNPVLANIIDAVVSAFDTMREWIATILSFVIDTVVECFIGVYETIQSYLTMAEEIISSILNYIRETFSNVFDFLLSLVQGDFQGMRDAINNQMENIRSLIENIWNSVKQFFSTVLGNLWATVQNRFSSMVQAVSNQMENIRGRIENVWNSVKQFFSNVLGNLWETVQNKFSDMVQAVRDKMTDVKNTAMDIWHNIQGFFEDINLLQTGKDIINGLWNGIKSMGRRLASNITSFIKDYIPGPVAKALGIASPSKVMAHMARWIPEGIAVGIDNNIRPLKNAVQSMVKIVPEKVDMPRIDIAGQVSGMHRQTRRKIYSNSNMHPYAKSPFSQLDQRNAEYNFHFHQPDISPGEAARKFKQTNRQLAMEAGF